MQNGVVSDLTAVKHRNGIYPAYSQHSSGRTAPDREAVFSLPPMYPIHYPIGIYRAGE
jgi:hypothetical protein